MAPSLNAADEIIALKAARLFDGKAKALVANGVVIVQGDKIHDAGSNLPIPAGRAGHRLGRRDSLARIHGRAHPPDLRFLGELSSDAACAICRRSRQRRPMPPSPTRGSRSKRDSPRSGMWAAGDFVDVALRDAIANGTVVGPRMLVATQRRGRDRRSLRRRERFSRQSFRQAIRFHRRNR